MSIIQCIGGFLAILILLYIHYWRCNRDEIVPINWPIIGMLPTILRPLSNFHDYTTLVLKHHGGMFRFDFLYESITFSKQEQSKCSSSEEMDDFVKALMKEGFGKGEMDEKYLRDNAITLFLAGNGPVRSGLIWFFWLVSTHLIVEAKIIQEIKDYLPTEEENQKRLRLH
ncbi:cytochrome P450 family protein [Medicago truncatula]|uniref:Cytochrome P450 family protein n=1 Tax=Medicago truncatula TaxID=3880 RepID=A0A072VGX2_MEDTR|nr:cytochrome P450 family protein [Medicago truncatula]